MKDSVKSNLKGIMEASGGAESFNQMMMILELPDDQFDQVYPQFKEQLENIMMNPQVQQEVLNTARTNPPSPEEKEEAKKAIEEFLAEINGDDTLSPNKKDMLNILIKSSVDLTFDMADNPRERIPVKIQKIRDDALLPEYAHPSDAGADIFAIEDVSIAPHKTEIVKTGLKVAIPAGYEIQIRPRSGLSLKTPLRIANAPGTIDSAYRGEVGVIIENTGNLTQTISKGDKIAQMVIAPVPMIVWETVDALDDTDRGEGGFGSTDKS